MVCTSSHHLQDGVDLKSTVRLERPSWRVSDWYLWKRELLQDCSGTCRVNSGRTLTHGYLHLVSFENIGRVAKTLEGHREWQYRR
ncbi:hypothetical protein AOXY_G6669 [Acipenser oxyrinchus oxyrinchus]|uniref:Uncharacterized protein n=1 Tax=Acipenser oxyrinchus oxyrinchus TaxID=40147 RepID=A0AAD8LQI8_ACIOX|nr:hypothetical protein AOXY_G6669 [Acipenser oxyrinchus oxyrinchus]